MASKGKMSDTISMEEVKKHCSANDCWMVIENNVYDVSKFAKYHPGGKIILHYAGQDATDPFYAFHGHDESFPAWSKLAAFKIGSLEKPLKLAPHVEDFRQLRTQLIHEGYFKPNFVWYLMIFAIMASFYAFGISLLWWLPHNLLTISLSAIIVGFSYGQGGLLQHDMGHNALFKSKKANQILHTIFYCFFMGGSPSWWNGRHNRHHASPNHDELDLDIRTLPLFAWDAKQFKRGPKEFLKWQVYYWPFLGPPVVLVFYRIINTFWIIQKRMYSEIIGTIIHFTFFPFLITRQISFGWYLYWLLVVLVAGGVYLGWIFALNHYMFPIYREGAERDWVLATLTTTQNVTSSTFIDWFTGHLDYQVEHHLFPRMPRHNYYKAHVLLEKVLKKHKIPIYEQGYFEACLNVFKILNKAISPK